MLVGAVMHSEDCLTCSVRTTEVSLPRPEFDPEATTASGTSAFQQIRVKSAAGQLLGQVHAISLPQQALSLDHQTPVASVGRLERSAR